MGRVISHPCDALKSEDALEVGAAGNYAVDGFRPEAEFPAALGSVIGVSSVTRKNQPASYSNLADAPVTQGVATFGGERGLDGEPIKADSVLGVYTAPTYPDGNTPNESGWALWSGTSFAAPVVTGVLALLRSSGVSSADAYESLLKNAKRVTHEGEDILEAVQGV